MALAKYNRERDSRLDNPQPRMRVLLRRGRLERRYASLIPGLERSGPSKMQPASGNAPARGPATEVQSEWRPARKQ